mmetsp:Transcript_23373/g.55410  ORF Transcript_23373/g.55410 Transcript_23373/m.55410 type:complete len:81 (-) Transcript_23373:566-808(-)
MQPKKGKLSVKESLPTRSGGDFSTGWWRIDMFFVDAHLETTIWICTSLEDQRAMFFFGGRRRRLGISRWSQILAVLFYIF